MALARIPRHAAGKLSLFSLRALAFAVAFFCCYVGQPTAQTREPDIRIGSDAHEMQFSAGGDYLLVEEFDRVKRYDLVRRRFDLQLSFPSRSDDKFALSSDGTRLARIDSETPQVQVIDFVSGDILYTLPYPTKNVSSLSEITFVGDNARLVVKDDKGLYFSRITSSVWNTIENGKFLAVSDSRHLYVIGTSDQVIVRIPRAADAAERETRKTIDGFLDDLSLSSDGDNLLVRERRFNDTGEEEVWHVLDARTLTLLAEPLVMSFDGLLGKGLSYIDCAWLGHRPIALYETIDDQVIVLDVREQSVPLLSLRSTVPTEYKTRLSPDGQWLAVRPFRTDRVEVHALDRVSVKTEVPPQPRLVPQLSHSGSVMGLTVSQDGSTVAIAGEDGWVSLWDRPSGREFHRLPFPHPGKVALSQDRSQVLIGASAGSVIWDVASGELRQLKSDGGELFAEFLDGDARALLCSRRMCILRELSLRQWWEPSSWLELELGEDRYDDVYYAVSLAPDESSIALALGAKGVGWMELSPDGRQRIIRIPGDIPDPAEVTAIAALGGTRVAAGLDNGYVLLVDAARGKILRTLRTSREVDALVRLDDTRLAVSLESRKGIFAQDNPKGEILIVSLRDLSVLQRLAWNRSVDSRGEGQSSGLFFRRDLLATGGDGRLLVSVSQPGSSQSQPFIQLWDTAAAQAIAVLDSPILPTRRVEFDKDNDLLLVDSDATASLWNLKDGRVTQQFRHLSCDTCAAFSDDTVIYVPSDGRGVVEAWSVRSGKYDITLPSDKQPEGLIADGSRLGVRVWDGLVLLPISKSGVQARYIDDSDIDGGNLYVTADRVLLDLRLNGIGSLSASSGELLWSRDDFIPDNNVLVLTADHTGVVVMVQPELTNSHTGEVIRVQDPRLLVLEAATGKTRFGLAAADGPLDLPYSVPVVNNTVVQGILRLTNDLKVERLSLRGGSVIDTTNLGISSLAFAASSRAGNVYLVSDGNGQAVLWDTTSGKRMAFEVEAVGPEGVAFSPDGRLLTIVETDGTVSLWDVSKGPAGLRRLARLITFNEGGWAVVGEDGRYDASDPADLEGLAWVMPDAPTKPVPLSIFYREYYEPRLLPRLLAGEVFPSITSIADLDRTQPQVKIAAVEPVGTSRVNVTVEAKKAGAKGVHDLKLFRDGSLVGLDERAGQTGSDTSDAWRITFPDIALPTSGGDSVEFSAYAFNADGVKSDTHRLRHTLPKGEPNPRRAFVIVVGVNAYQNSSWDLRYAAEDAQATGGIVARHLEASGAFEEVHTVSLITERDESGAITGTATRASLLAVLDVLAGETGDRELLNALPGAASLSKARPDDLVYLAFSGHGLSGDKGLFHLFLSDIGEGEGRTVTSALLARTLDSDLLARHLRRVDAGEFVMVIDACNSAASVEGGGFKPGPMGSRGLGQLAYDKAMRVLAASQAEAVALESDQLRHGLLTFAMLHEGLVGGAADRAPTDRAVDFSELLNYGVDRVPLLYEDIRSDSFTPQGRGLTAEFTPNGQVAVPTSTQRPSLFDFGRGKREVRMPVIDQTN